MVKKLATLSHQEETLVFSENDFKLMNDDNNVPVSSKFIEQVAVASGLFNSEIVTKKRNRRESYYKVQFNIRCKPKMKELFQSISDHLEILDHTTFERAILALIEKDPEKLGKFLQQYKEIVAQGK